MTWVDVGILVFTLVMAAWGYAQGLVVGALSLGGFVAGGLIGSRVGPLLLDEGSRSPFAPLFTLMGALLIGGLLAAAIGIQAVYYLGGALLLLAAVVGWHGLEPTSERLDGAGR
jgi:uncharacterized membrane protein required for colicin V production